MIKYQTVRQDEWGRCTPLPEEEVSLERALTLLAFTDLEFGGLVLDYNETKLVSKSGVFGTFDVSTFTGSWDEMQPLTQIGRYLKERGFGPYRIYPTGGGGISYSITAKGERLTRSETIKALLFHALGLRDYQKTIFKKTLEDLIAALTLFEHPTAHVKDIYSLLGE